MAFAFKPTNADAISVVIGVNETLQGFIIQNLNITDSAQNLEIADQKGRVAQVIAYDKGKTLTFTAIGPGALGISVGDSLSVDSSTGVISVAQTGGDYIVQSVERACTYNDTAKWNVTAQGWEHASYSNKTEDEL